MSGTLALAIEAAARQVAADEYILHVYRDEPLAAARVAEQIQAARQELARLQALAPKGGTR